MRNFAILIASIMVLSSCAGKLTYLPPTSNNVKRKITIKSSKRKVWKNAIKSLARSFFVVNNLDKDSGFINVSYSGSPEQYIDCGYIKSYVKNARGERNYYFPAATSYKEYEVFEDGINLLFVKRKMNLDGRINIVIQSINNYKTQVSVKIGRAHV